MGSRRRLAYHTRLFILLLCFSWILVACFVGYQYRREKQYKVEKLNGQLQLYNMRLIDAIGEDSLDFASVIARLPLPIDGLRVSVIGIDGTLVFDNTLDSLSNDNHLGRNEIRMAMIDGTGYTIRRHSTSTNLTYFYSAMRDCNIIVRSAVPYSVSLQEVLKADRSFLWFMLAVTLAIGVLANFATRRIGRTITRLNRFAEKAERGESVYDVEAFPNDELGSISNHIVRLYVRLQHTMEKLDNEHNRAMHEQQEKIRIKKQLTNNINHELKTPVASINVCLETLLEHRNMAPEKHWEFIEKCYCHIQQLANLLNDVSAIDRLDDGSLAIEKSMMNINALLDDIVSGLNEQLKKAGITVDIRLPEGLVVKGNRSLLDSVFRNLIVNSIAYSGGSVIIVALEDETDEAYTLSVADNGIGIPDEHLDRIFERFYRIDKGRSRQMGGTGLGLSIVRNAVKFHGGTIYVVNQYDGGAKFVFSLRK